jgi:inosine-uridine nucleoside N-ribohydrolase
MRAFLIDTDVASDDAVALIMALRASDVRVVGITTVAGNVVVDQATLNALYTVELCGAEVPVYKGASKPLNRDHQNATWFHGEDGLGDHGYAPSTQKAAQTPAADAIIEAAQTYPGLVIITLGPLTNVAVALKTDSSFAKNVSRCVVMGGAPCCEGNVTPAAEYNIWVDPEAARVVMRSELPIELIGWQTSRGESVLNDRDIAQIQKFHTPLADFAIECNSQARKAYKIQTGEDGISLPDPVAMSIALDPSIGTEWSTHHVDVEVESVLTRGMTVVDRLNVASDDRNAGVWKELLKTPPHVKVCWTIDPRRWKAALYSALQT